MGIFNNLFISNEEKIRREIIKNKPQTLMHTSTVFPDKIYTIRPTYNKETKNNSVFATDDEKLATLYALQPFFSFRFSKNKSEIGVILLGNQHDLLKLDSKIAYTYFVNSESFNPIIEEKTGYYEHEWISLTEVSIRKDIQPKKICFNDVLRHGIQVFWINSPETLLEIDKEMVDNNIVTGDQKIEYLINQTNWKPDKVMYINQFRNICPVNKTDNGYVVDYSKQINIQNDINTKQY